MLTASILLMALGVLGAFDIAYFHHHRSQLLVKPECARESWIHVARGIIYTAQFLLVPNIAFHGRWSWAFAALMVLDVAIGFSDILEEPRSRARQGGISGGEYFMHMLLSVIVGAELLACGQAAWSWRQEATALVLHGEVPMSIRVVLGMMALGAFAVSVLEALALGAQDAKPRPIHVRVTVPAPVHRVWNTTQDHRLHPSWDHRFSRITMVHEDEQGSWDGPERTPDPRIQAGTLMRYEKRVAGVLIAGFGRYKLHKPMRQSTFAFWSDDWRSLIASGVGLWLYTPLPDGSTEFSTSYTYEVRWGALGKVVDRWLFRPMFQWYTEQSFRRLMRNHFGVRSPRVWGREGAKPAHARSLSAA